MHIYEFCREYYIMKKELYYFKFDSKLLVFIWKWFIARSVTSVGTERSQISDLGVWGIGHFAEWVLMSSRDVYSSFVTVADPIRDTSNTPDLQIWKSDISATGEGANFAAT